MKPPRFQYCAPRILDEALALLAQYGEDAKILAGGQSLIPLLNMRLAGPAYLVDINHISELQYIEHEDGYLAIGAIVRQRQVERASLVQEQHRLAECPCKDFGLSRAIDTDHRVPFIRQSQ